MTPREAVGQAATSSSFILAQSVIGSVGEGAQSASFRVDGTLAQPGTVGESSSTSLVLQSGFWTSLSTLRILKVVGTGTGRGGATGAGFACTLDGGTASGVCSNGFVDGASVAIIAAPDIGSVFSGWSGCDATATTVLPDDTCQVTMEQGRTVTVAFTRLATVGDRVWLDYDGDGTQDGGEPGLDGITVSLSDGAAYSAVTTTTNGGQYAFLAVPPGDYSLEVDAATLQPGAVPSFDRDGIATPHMVQLSVAFAQDVTDADFGYQPLVDLAITKKDSADPLPGGQNLVYTITVTNLGPGAAESVWVMDTLPTATTPVATSGCAEDPVGTPVCTLGSLAVGAQVSYTIELVIAPAPPGSITNTAVVRSLEADLDGSNNTASETTQLDDAPPQVVFVAADPIAADGELEPCESVHGQWVEGMVVRFDEPLSDPPGDTTPGDVSNPNSFFLVAAGPDGKIESAECGQLAGDDVPVLIASVGYDGPTGTAALGLDRRLDPGLHRLFACAQGASALVDLAGNPLDGNSDGVAGDDFVLPFRSDPENLLANGHVDCNLDGWTLGRDDPAEIVFDSTDMDDCTDSGSARVDNLLGGPDFSLTQCVVVEAGADELHLELSSGALLSTGSAGIGFELGCTFFPDASCSGATSSPVVAAAMVEDTGGAWIELGFDLTAPPGTSSAECWVELTDLFGAGFVGLLDHLVLRDQPLFFADGFESGNTQAWSVTVP